MLKTAAMTTMRQYFLCLPFDINIRQSDEVRLGGPLGGNFCVKSTWCFLLNHQFASDLWFNRLTASDLLRN